MPAPDAPTPQGKGRVPHPPHPGGLGSGVDPTMEAAMAIFPCDMCRRRYPGRGNTVYLGWSAGSHNDREKLNLCSIHVDQVQAWLQENLKLIEVGGVMQTDETEISRTCERCGLEPTTQTWYANTYIRTADPAVYAVGLCEKCGGYLDVDRPRAA